MAENMLDGKAAFAPKCVASTPDRAHAIPNTNNHNSPQASRDGHFRSANWTTDGTTIIASTADSTISTYIVPPDLLDHHPGPIPLSPYSTIPSREPINTLTTYPLFNLQDPRTTLLLSSVREHPIHLHSALEPTLLANYPLIHPPTETFLTPSALYFHPHGTHFLTGSPNQISTFDLSRPGQAPLSTFRTTNHSNPSLHQHGIISALSINPATPLLASGTFTRTIGLYPLTSSTSSPTHSLGTFTLHHNPADASIHGNGVTHLHWSPCSRYLYIAERKSDGIQCYDIRRTGELLSWAVGRNAMSNQRLGVDIVPRSASGAATSDNSDSYSTSNNSNSTSNSNSTNNNNNSNNSTSNINTNSTKSTESSTSGTKILAGATDGTVQVWDRIEKVQGPVQPIRSWRGHDEAVSGLSVHPIATTSTRGGGSSSHGAEGDDGGDSSNHRAEGDDVGGSGSHGAERGNGDGSSNHGAEGGDGGLVLATCSGQRHFSDVTYDEDDNHRQKVRHESTLKIWTV